MELVRSKNSRRNSVLALAVLASTSVLFLERPVQAATEYLDLNGATTGLGAPTANQVITWNDTTTIWATALSPGTTAPGAWVPGSTGSFTTGSAALPFTMQLAADETFAGLYDTATGSVITLSFATGGDLRPTGTGTFSITSSTGNFIVTAPIVGTGGIQQNGSGQLSLYGNNTFTGGYTSTGGQVVNFNNSNSFGMGPITFVGTSGQGLVGTNTASIQIANNIVFSTVGASTNFASPAVGVNFSGTVALPASGAASFNAAAVSVNEFSGIISGAAGINFGLNGNGGTFILSGANTFQGGATLSTGNLVLGNDSALGVTTSNLSLTGGTLQTNATRSVSNPVLLTGNSAVGGSNNLTFSNTVTGSTASRTLTVSNTGVTTLAGNVLIREAAGAGASTLTLTSTGRTNVTGVISNGGAGANVIAFNGTNVATLSGANTYTGGTSIGGVGSLVAANSSGLGTGAATLTSGNLRATAGTTISNPITVATPLVSGYDFQTTYAGGTAATVAPSPNVYLANVGLGGTLSLSSSKLGASSFNNTSTASEVTAFTGTAVNAGNGLNGSTSTTSSLAIQGGTATPSTVNGKSAVFQVDAGASTSLSLTYATQGTSTGPTSQTWTYSFDDVTFMSLGTITPPTGFATQTLPAISNGGNALGTVYYKLTFAGATAATGNNRLDNIQFLGSGAALTSGSNISTIGSDDTSGVINYTGAVTLNDNVNLTAGTGSRVNFGGAIGGPTAGYAVAVNKIGGGSVVLSGANTYLGTTKVTAGELALRNTSGSATGGSAITVGPTATLSGGGSATGIVTLAAQGASTVGGTISPDSYEFTQNNRFGALTTGGGVWNAGAVYSLDVADTGPTNDAVTAAGVASDYVSMTGGLDLTGLSSTGKFVINLVYGGGVIGQTFAIAQASSFTGVTGNLNDLFQIEVNGATSADYQVIETDSGGVSFLDIAQNAPTPELGSVTLFGSGAAVMSILRRRRSTTSPVWNQAMAC